MPSPSLAVQLYTLRDLLDVDLEGTLAAVAATGVDTVETAGMHGRAAPEFRAALDAAGLAVCAAHVPLDRIEAEFELVLEELAVLGTTTLVVPWVPPPVTAADADATMTRITAATRAATAAGLRVAYHNHDFEFLALPRAAHSSPLRSEGGGEDLWHRLTVPDAAWLLEPDAGWLRVAGRDPAEELRGLAGRCPLVHAKDVRPLGRAWRDVPVGDGVLDWPDLAAAAREAGAEHLVVEFDTPTNDTAGDVGRSVAFLRDVLAA